MGKQVCVYLIFSHIYHIFIYIMYIYTHTHEMHVSIRYTSSSASNNFWGTLMFYGKEGIN